MAPLLAVTPVTLDGAHVRLEPLTRDHADALAEVALDPELWAWTGSSVRLAPTSTPA